MTALADLPMAQAGPRMYRDPGSPGPGPRGPRSRRGVVRLGRHRAVDRLRRGPPPAGHLVLGPPGHSRHLAGRGRMLRGLRAACLAGRRACDQRPDPAVRPVVSNLLVRARDGDRPGPHAARGRRSSGPAGRPIRRIGQRAVPGLVRRRPARGSAGPAGPGPAGPGPAGGGQDHSPDQSVFENQWLRALAGLRSTAQGRRACRFPFQRSGWRSGIHDCPQASRSRETRVPAGTAQRRGQEVQR